MKNVSTEFREKVENGSACYAYANVVLRNGTKLTLDPSKDFRIDGNSITTNGGSSFPLGVALSRTIELNLDNYDGRFDSIDFYGAEITLFTGMTLDDGSVEKIKEGIFSVVEPTTPGSTIALVAADYMAKTSDSYVANTTFPATVFNIYRDVCIQCNLVAGSAKFTNGDFVVDAISENVTCRDMLGYIAMIAGGNAICDSNGAVIIKSYDFSGLKKSDGTYDYTKAQNFSGFQKNPSISTDMIRITGVKAENDDGDEKQSYIVGSEDYCFLIENPLISGKEAQALQLIGNVIVGLEFYTFSGDHISNPLAEFMDPCFVQDMKGNLFFSVLSNITYTYLGSTSISCDTDSPETVKSQKATSGSKVYQNLKKQQQVIKKEFEKQMDALEKQVSNAPGTYISSEVQPDGSSIYYLHDKPTLAESKSVFKITADTITASTDGGKTWNGGFTVDGAMIAKIMTTIGINFDWGVGGTLIIQDRNGKQTVYMDAETGEVRLSVVSLSIQGETVADIAEKKAESSLNDFKSNIYNPMISNLQKQIDGQIETFYYDYEPTLNNVPAKEWDTEEKKTAHEGDLFYWKSKGYAYRFQKDGSAWSWQLVQDTDITLAMQKAAEAKDTADSKRRVFTATPYPPYDVGDLWVGNDTSDLMRCQRSRQSGSYDASDWIKAVKYTDDSALNNFIYTDYAETLVEISNSIDKKAETWFQATDPALQWTDNSTSEPLQDHTGANITDSTGANILTVWEREKAAHNGDLWHNTTNNVEYIYKDGSWHEMSVPDDVFDKIDGKAQIFAGEPIPPYDVGDTWFTGTTILVCVVKRTSGKYNASDWAKKDTYTDDTALENFLSGDYKETIANLSTQIDGKAETWRQSTDPAANWTTDELKVQHKGDLWNNTENQKTYIYNGSAWQEMTSTPPRAVFDAIDGKAQIFVKQPTTPYDVGDLWFDSSSADIMTCTTARESGNFNAADWEKRNKYTDDSSLNSWIKGDYAKTLEDVQTQIDGKAETWRQSTDPSKSWTTDALKKQHKGDLWYNTTEQKSYIYNGSAWEQMKAEPPSGVYDAIDGKAQIFVSQPKPPYSVGDLWFDSSTADIMTCVTARESGSYVAGDWQKRNKYTDDSAVKAVSKELGDFIAAYDDEMEKISNSIDKKAETWYQTTDPALQWTGTTEEALLDHTGATVTDSTGAAIMTVIESEKMVHDGDLWKNPSTNKEYIYQAGIWKEMSIPNDVFDIIDGKAQIFVSEPKPPYSVGDLWFNSATSDILTCVVARESGSYVASDWQKRNKYTDDSSLNSWIKGEYANTLADVKNQIDGKAETWRQSTDPSKSWTTDALKKQHKGDLWYNTTEQKSYIYNGSAWEQMKAEPPSGVYDAIDGKAQIFVSQPKPPYSVGDLWFDSTSADIMTCVTARKSGDFAAADWQKRNKYTDDSAVDALDKALTQLEIFNRLTNNGAAQGVFLKDGKLYLNFSYAQGGTLKLGGVNNGNGQAEVYDSSGNKIGSWNKDGFNLQKGSIYGTQIHLESQNDYIQGTVNGNEAVKISTGGVKVDSTANWGLGVTRKEYIFEMNPYLFPGVRLLDQSTGAGIGSTWTSGHFGMCYTDDLSGYSSVTDSLSNYGVYMKAGKEDANGGFYVIGNGLGKGSRVTTEGIYTSGTKNRIVDTENYGQRLQYCYEMPSPFFGDIGEAETDENGLCYVQIDDIFGETVLRNDKYNVFLQKEGCGDLWIEEKTADYFLVKGTPNLSFSWELKAKQADYTLERLEKNETSYEKEPELDYSEIGYQTYIDYVESKIIA
jgi:phage-related protein